MGDLEIYIDSDGVIFDTIDTGKRLAKESGYDPEDFWGLHEYFVQVDWYILMHEAGILDNAIRKIKCIIEDDDVKIVKILTKLCGADTEEPAKRINYYKLLYDVEVITVEFDENKDEVVDPKGKVLIDDSWSNIKRWREAGGVGILFSKTECDLENDIINDLLLFKETKGVQALLHKEECKKLELKNV